MSERIKVVIAGINGRMGRASARLLSGSEEAQLAGAFGRPGAGYVGKDTGELTGAGSWGILVSNDLEGLPAGTRPDVLLDFSFAEAAFENAKMALDRGIRPVIGTSGLGEEEIRVLSEIASSKGTGALVVPNFSVGAVLMIEFARQAGRFFSNVELVEMHHTRKVDAPSGTAMYTASRLASVSDSFNRQEVEEKELVPGSRGGVTKAGVRIHSLRLPGLISHQEVIFGSQGELLTIRHDSFNTDCFLKGIVLAVKAVMKLDRLVVGLENILELNDTAN